MPELVITRGLPASGKTTWARAWVAEAEGASRVRVNRDDLRAMLYDRPVLEFAEEQRVTDAQHAAVRALLLAGSSVVVDDTHLRLRYARAWADLALDVGAQFRVVDIDTSLEECLRRDAARAAAGERAVGERVLREMAARFGGPRLPVAATEQVQAAVTYVPDQVLPACVLVDIDGTVAHLGDRGRFEEHLVGRDLPNPVVIDVVRRLHASGLDIVFLSGRGSGCREQTQAWLDEHVGAGVASGLFMRTQGDMRKDAIVKLELLMAEVAPRWVVQFVLDDRDQVVAAWRRAGLTVFQVAEGDF